MTEEDCQTTYEQECFEDAGEEQCETVNEQICQQVRSHTVNQLSRGVPRGRKVVSNG